MSEGLEFGGGGDAPSRELSTAGTRYRTDELQESHQAKAVSKNMHAPLRSGPKRIGDRIGA